MEADEVQAAFRKLSNVQLPSSFMSLENSSNVSSCVIMKETGLLFCGCQDNSIKVWDLQDFVCSKTLKGHSRSIISLKIEKLLLFSSAADKTIRVWDTAKDFACIRIINNYNGHVFSMSALDDRLYMGNQSTTIRICSLTESKDIIDQFTEVEGHIGYVYSLALISPNFLLSASGDKTIKVWSLPDMQLMTTLVGHTGTVYALEVNSSIFSASQDKTIRCWDLDTFHCKSILEGHTGEVLALCTTTDGKMLCSGSSDNTVRVWNTCNMLCLHVLMGARQAIVGLESFKSFVISACENGVIEIWSLNFLEEVQESTCEVGGIKEIDNDSAIVESLRKFVSISCVSGAPHLHQECWNGAKFLQSYLQQLGAKCRFYHASPGINPIVVGSLIIDESQPTILICGHYDVQPADVNDGWDSPPFVLTGRDGYLYGRGATDDKGPIITTLYAIKDCLHSSIPHPNFVFLYEGEGENGSQGFRQCVEANLDLFLGIRLIFISNNYWLGDDIPCLTYGMRGSLQLKVDVNGPTKDLHSGVDGGAIREPLQDLIALLNLVIDSSSGLCTSKEFYENVQPITSDEEQLYRSIQLDLSKYMKRLGVSQLSFAQEEDQKAKLLMNLWRNPHISVSNIKCSIENSSTIPKQATAHIGIRTVPNQNLQDTERIIVEWISNRFASLASPNTLSTIVVDNVSWWLGDTTNVYFQSAAQALEKHWKCKPMHVREGGTSQISGYLEEKLKAPCLHFPMGQSSDRAHLQNERIRFKNLVMSRKVLFDFFIEICKFP